MLLEVKLLIALFRIEDDVWIVEVCHQYINNLTDLFSNNQANLFSIDVYVSSLDCVMVFNDVRFISHLRSTLLKL